MFEQIVARLKPRDILPKIIAFLKTEEIILLTGARQTGKTSLMYLLANYLVKEKNIPEDQIIWLDMEKVIDLTAVNSIQDYDDFLFFLASKGVDLKQKVYVFIDEVQYINHASSFLKYLYDRYRLQLKFILSGSSSLDLKKKFSDRLTGRVVRFAIEALSFAEYLKFKNKPAGDQEKSYLLADYLKYGGYPKITLTESVQIKEKLLSEIYSLYVKKDIKDIAGIQDIYGFNKLVSLLSLQVGNLVNEVELANSSGLSRITVRKYLFILENTFVLDFISPYYRNPRTEIIKTPKVYFKDLGLRNAVTENFVDPEKRDDSGSLAENFVYLQLAKKYSKVNFWRSKSKAEVDFVVKDGKQFIPIEVKYKPFSRPQMPISLKIFIKNNQSRQAIVINKTLTSELKFLNCRVIFKPIYQI